MKGDDDLVCEGDDVIRFVGTTGSRKNLCSITIRDQDVVKQAGTMWLNIEVSKINLDYFPRFNYYCVWSVRFVRVRLGEVRGLHLSTVVKRWNHCSPRKLES